MCLQNGNPPEGLPGNEVVGYCFQERHNYKDQVRFGSVFHGGRTYILGKRYRMTDAHHRRKEQFIGDGGELEIGFYGFFSLEDALQFVDMYLEESVDLVLMEAKFEGVIEVGNPTTFGLPEERDVLCFRAKYRTLVKVEEQDLDWLECPRVKGKDGEL